MTILQSVFARGAWTRPAVLAGLLPVLAACGASSGGGSSGSAAQDDFDPVTGTENAGTTIGNFQDTTNATPSALSFIAIDDGVGTSGTTGALDHAANTVTAGILQGDLNAGRTEIALDGGGTATLTNPASTEFARFFRIESPTDTRVGVVGMTAADIPTDGTVNYGGHVDLTFVRRNDPPRSVDGAANVSVNFDTNRVTTTFGDLSETGGLSNVGTLTISGATLVGDSFSGGTASGTGLLDLDATSAGVQSATGGQLYGPNADEVGGVVAISTDDLTVQGAYIAE